MNYLPAEISPRKGINAKELQPLGMNAPRVRTKVKKQKHQRKSSVPKVNHDIENVIDHLVKESPQKSSSPKKREGRLSKASGVLMTGRHSFDMNEMFEFAEDTRNIEKLNKKMLTHQENEQKIGAGFNGDSSIKSFKSMLGRTKLQHNEKY